MRRFGGDPVQVDAHGLGAPLTSFQRYAIIFALAAPASVVTWFVFHGVFVNLSQTETAMGYVDPLTQMGIDLGYVAMFGGTLVFAAIAVWAAVRALMARGRGDDEVL
jgi:hypothetical protein